ncbi:MAG TPA: PQQ-dependent sugar dehydrogenase [Myxococcota bacterium]|nr:PQQ-dependent sugar dehydrogenase [Myxococcota bacterium]
MPFAGHNLPLDSLPDPAPMTAVRVWPNITYDSATSLAFAPDGSGFALATEQQGHVHVVPTDPNSATTPVFLDLTNGEVQFDNAEQGMLSVEFDPNWATNHFIYVDYVAPGSRCQTGTYCTKVVRYTQSAGNPNLADPNSRRPILEVPDNNNFHNGGQLKFGPDGMLYVSIGDAGTMSGQDTSKLLGVIVRIDPNGGNPYAIPAGNPFIGQSGKRAEIWDYGLRNPWRFTFDRLTGDLWVGDVGENSWEEADFVPGNVPGQNFGWSFCEGTHDYGGKTCSSIQSTLPVLQYPHDSNTGGYAIAGGYVYRGDLFPELYGAYLYADEVSGHVWAYSPASQVSTRIAEMTNPVSWAQDSLGELVIVSHAGGLYKLQPTQGSGTQQFPTALSGTGLFTDTTALTPKPGLVEYDVISPLWSDGALKRRWIALPAGQTVGFSPDDPWTFPVGTVFVKHFELQVTPTTRRRVETRVLLRQVDRWVGYTYRWNAGQTDAALLTASMNEAFTITGSGGTQTQQTWHYPSPSECLGCHTAASGRVLGARTRQLNKSFTYAGGADNQLHAFGACMGLFATSIAGPSFYPALADPNNASETLNARARSYLAANCAHCHQPGGPAPGSMDMRYEPLLGAMSLIGVAPISGDLGISGALRVKPGASAQSVLWARVASTDPNLRMAKGSQIPDPLAVSLLGSWIDTGLGTIDSDGDGDADSADNCPYEPNADQSDGGGWMSSTHDGIGDACQCGNTDPNGVVNSLDLNALRQYLAGNPGRTVANVARLVRYPDVAGRPSVLDFAHLQRAQSGVEAAYSQTCPAATRLLP